MGFVQIFTMICMAAMAVGIILVAYKNVKVSDENETIKEEISHFREENKNLTNDRNRLECENESLEEEIKNIRKNAIDNVEKVIYNDGLAVPTEEVELEEVALLEKDDMLISLFEKQKELQKKFYPGYLPADEPKIMGENILALLAELGEVMQEDKRWKSWCKNSPEVIQIKKKEEIIDCIHFMINICIYSGMDAEELHYLFTKKNKLNHERQESDY